MLVHRGIESPTQATKFLNPKLDHLHDPSLMLGIDRTVRRIFKARDNGEYVLIYGDYDVDGITSTVVLKRALEMINVKVDFHIPRRLEDGYGLKLHLIKEAHSRGVSLIITTDSGIREFEVCNAARELGLDLIVTDHHLPDKTLPKAYAIVNPLQPNCDYPDSNLSAVGVVFKLVQAIFREIGNEKVVHHFLKLVAIGTIADLVPLVGENRVFARLGLEGLSNPRNLGLKILLEELCLSTQIQSSDIGFKVAPRINAVTRMGGGREIVDLFSVLEEETARKIVAEMNNKNVRRRRIERAILEEVKEQISREPKLIERKVLVFVGENWHRGVIGIVASRIVDLYYRPTLIFSLENNSIQGSGRSIPGFHFLDALNSCRDAFEKFGGHAQAVGCTLQSPNLESKIKIIEEGLENYGKRILVEDMLIPSLNIDAILPIQKLSFSLLHEIQCLAPFGVGNPLPVFASRKARLVSGPFLIKDTHLKIQIGSEDRPLEAIWWQNGSVAKKLESVDQIDLAYTLSNEVYRGNSKLLLTIQDIKKR